MDTDSGLSPSRSLIQPVPASAPGTIASTGSVFERAKQKILKTSISDIFGAFKPKKGMESMSGRAGMSGESEDVTVDERTRTQSVGSSSMDGNGFEAKRSLSIRIHANPYNVASEDQFEYNGFVNRPGMCPPTNSVTQRTPQIKTIKLPNGQYEKRIYGADEIVLEDDDATVISTDYFQYPHSLTEQNTMDLESLDDDTVDTGDPYEAIEKGHVWQRSP